MPDECSSGKRGENISPPLAWEDPPAGTACFALLVEDLDVPAFIKVTHWIVYNIPAQARSMGRGFPAGLHMPDGSTQGLNFYRRHRYLGPNPIPARSLHRYRFRLMALDTRLAEEEAMSRAKLLKAIRGHLLGEARLIGIFGGDADRGH
jgi:Raf kinase inhibitor-like YbhB/YbcL family protein